MARLVLHLSQVKDGTHNMPQGLREEREGEEEERAGEEREGEERSISKVMCMSVMIKAGAYIASQHQLCTGRTYSFISAA